MGRPAKEVGNQPLKVVASQLSDLPDLNEKQSAFVNLILAGVNPVEAYRQSHDPEGRLKPASLASMATRLRVSDKVAPWIEAAQMIGLERGIVSLEGHLAELARLRNVSEQTGNMGAAVNAEMLRGKASGLYIERVEHSVAPSTVEALDRIARLNVEAARQLAQKHNVPWMPLSERLEASHTTETVIEHDPT